MIAVLEQLGPRARSLGLDVIQLSKLPAGAEATIVGAELPPCDAALLDAMGLAEQSPLLVVRQGEPCIVQVRGTRVGLTAPIANRILVSLPSGAA